MPRVTSYTPPWLRRPSPGYDLFAPHGPLTLDTSVSGQDLAASPRRLLACRGTELFVVVKNELRWSDLVLLRETWNGGQSQTQQTTTNDFVEEQGQAAQPCYKVATFSSQQYKRTLI